MTSSALVFGVSGFLGGYIAAELIASGYLVTGIDSGSRRRHTLPGLTHYAQLPVHGEAMHSLLQELQPSIVINCAGSASVGESLIHPSLDFRANTILVFDILEALRNASPHSRFIMLSSAAVYGNSLDLPIRESHGLNPVSPYGFHKLQAESLCIEYSRIYGMQTAIARIFSAYGAGLQRQVIWEMVRRALLNGAVELMGTGEETRDFIHARDVSRAIRILAETCPFQAEAYNVASGQDVSIRELAETVTLMVGNQTFPHFTGKDDPGTPKNWRADISKLQALGYVPSVPLRDGLREVLLWGQQKLSKSGDN
jgi:UDP-glucose 4-epimerase